MHGSGSAGAMKNKRENTKEKKAACSAPGTVQKAIIVLLEFHIQSSTDFSGNVKKNKWK